MKFLNAKIADKIEKYYTTGEVEVTTFMDPSEIIEVNGMLKYIESVAVGGYEEAERKILLIGTSDEEVVKKYISIIRAVAHEDVKLSHRSVLGSVLGLGIKREMIGDIIINNNICDIIAVNTVAEYILSNLKSIGRDKVKTSTVDVSELLELENTSKEIKTTVKSLRIDAVISAGFGVSREKSAELVKNEMVKINFVVTKSATKNVKKDDVISVRGKGRLIVADILGETRSDRIRIVIIRK